MTWQPLVEAIPYRDGVAVDPGPTTQVWMNDLYIVHCRIQAADDPNDPPMYHLSIRNNDRSTRHDWRDFQRIKNQLAGPEYEGVELYPAESRKVDTANQYHLWCFPFTLGFGLGARRMVTNYQETCEAEPGAVQRDNEDIDGPLNDVEQLKEWTASHG